MPHPAPAGQTLYRDLFGDAETATYFTDAAEIAALLAVEAALAKVQGAMGMIPETAAQSLATELPRLQIAPEALAAGTAISGVPIPALLGEIRKALADPEVSQYLHWGATSQDIVDTGLTLRLRGLIALWQDRLAALIAALGALAAEHADLPMAGRSYGQVAVPTSFGAVLASWGWPLLRHHRALQALAPELLRVSLSGAAGTLSAIGPEGPKLRAALAAQLGLGDPLHGWHSDRSGIAGFGGWMAGVLGSLGKLGEDLILLTQSGIAEVQIAGAGGSSTMPQKQNPVGPSVLVALARQGLALAPALQGSAIFRQQRDGAAWFTEWLVLPQLCQATGKSLALALDLAARLTPQPQAMAQGLDDGAGLIHAEALSFALAQRMPLPEAQAKIKSFCAQARPGGPSLSDLVASEFPGTAVTGGGVGTAPDEARAFADEAMEFGR